jgi:hypothetical protein
MGASSSFPLINECQDSTTIQPKKVKEKLTRAQRNKRRRAKEMQGKHESQKRTKKIFNSINNVATKEGGDSLGAVKPKGDLLSDLSNL